VKHLWMGLISIAVALCAVAGVQAAPRPTTTGVKFGPVVEGAIAFGGDTVGVVEFTNGDTQDLKAGNGGSLAVGVHLQPTVDSPWDLRATVGYKYTGVNARNADITLTRTVWQLIGSYEYVSGFRIGAGVVHHHGVHFNGDGYFDDVDFDNATGPIFEFGWRWIALTFTDMTYQARYPYSGDLNANNVGLRFAWEF
jgi:hypothetical protein